MSATEIRSRYQAAEKTLQSTNTNAQRLIQLIRFNDPIRLFEFLASIPRAQILRLMNSKLEGLDLTPINYAIKCSASHLILVMLLRSGAVFPNGLLSTGGDHPLLTAVRAGNVTFVKILLTVNGNVNVLDGEGYSLLHWASFKGNVLMARILIKNPDFSFHNHDRNVRKITPLGIAIEMKHAGLVKELCRCSKVDPNIIDSSSKRYLYDLAAENGFHFACYQLEKAFIRRKKGSLKTAFHGQHEYQVQFATQHQIRSIWCHFVNDPRGAFSFSKSSKRLTELPFSKEWKVYVNENMHDAKDGWIQSYLTDAQGRPMIVNWDLSKLTPAIPFFNDIDNYRFRHLTRLLKNKKQ